MLHIYVTISKFILILFILIYTFESFRVFKISDDAEKLSSLYLGQRIIIYLLHLLAFSVLFFTTMDTQILGLYFLQILLLTSIFVLYHIFYKNCSKLLLNHMCMLLTIGFVILTRLSYQKSLRQFFFCIIGLLVCILIPIILQTVSLFRKLTWVYAAVGIISLLFVAIFGAVSYGAKLSIHIGSFSIQPSEFVKILFVFFIAGMMNEVNNFRQVLITSGVSAAFVLVLVASKDLGSAFLFFVAYLIMIYVSTGKTYYFFGGLGIMAIAAFAGYKIFSHVQNRVAAWLHPLAVYDKEGYQVSQSLFGIGTGGWFGLGLNQGMPSKIPVVEKDFVFAAISEELGGVFALCLIILCLSVFLMFMNIALQMKDPFYKLVVLGLSVIYATQIFLTIGGTIKFIPSTGVTLPLISYGGSSLLSTFIIFGIIQGMYMRNEDASTNTTKDNRVEVIKKDLNLIHERKKEENK